MRLVTASVLEPYRYVGIEGVPGGPTCLQSLRVYVFLCVVCPACGIVHRAARGEEESKVEVAAAAGVPVPQQDGSRLYIVASVLAAHIDWRIVCGRIRGIPRFYLGNL